MTALHVDIFNEDGSVSVRHIFYAETEAEARDLRESHLRDCHYFQRAEREGRIGQFVEDVDEDDVPHEDDYEESDEEEDDEDNE